MYGIFNKYGMRLAHFGVFQTREDAYRVLRKAMQSLPDKNVTILPLDKNESS